MSAVGARRPSTQAPFPRSVTCRIPLTPPGPFVRKVRFPAKLPRPVCDQAIAVPLHAAQHVRAVPDDQVRPGVDDGMRERPQVAALLAEERRHAARDVALLLALGAAVEGDDDDVGPARRLAHGLPGLRDVEQALARRVEAEAEHDHAHGALADARCVADEPGVRELRAARAATVSSIPVWP